MMARIHPSVLIINATFDLDTRKEIIKKLHTLIAEYLPELQKVHFSIPCGPLAHTQVTDIKGNLV